MGMLRRKPAHLATTIPSVHIVHYTWDYGQFSELESGLAWRDLTWALEEADFARAKVTFEKKWWRRESWRWVHGDWRLSNSDVAG